MIWPAKLLHAVSQISSHRKMICVAGPQNPPGEESIMHENVPNALPEKEAVKQLISDSSDLLARLQKPKARRSKAGQQADPRPASSGKAEASGKAKTVVLEEATEFEVGSPCQRQQHTASPGNWGMFS